MHQDTHTHRRGPEGLLEGEGLGLDGTRHVRVSCQPVDVTLPSVVQPTVTVGSALPGAGRAVPEYRPTSIEPVPGPSYSDTKSKPDSVLKLEKVASMRPAGEVCTTTWQFSPLP